VYYPSPDYNYNDMQNRSVRFLDLSVRDQDERHELEAVFAEHLISGQFIISDISNSFESVFAKKVGRKYCIGVNSGTDALTIGMRLLNLPINSKVLTSPLSWIASSTSILNAGLLPEFIDIDDSLQIDLDLVEKYLEDNTAEIVSAILIPHLHGNVSQLSRLVDIKQKYGVRIVEDCAQAYGAVDIDRRMAGQVGDIAAFSFNPMKVLGGLGDAGAVLFDDDEFLQRGKSLRHSGVCGSVGLASELATNCRLDAIQASFLNVRIRHFDKHLKRRMQVFEMYKRSLDHLLPTVTEDGSRSNHYCYQTITESRSELLDYLQVHGIEAKIRHEPVIPAHPIFSAPSTCIPLATKYVKQIIALPMHHNLSIADAQYVITMVKQFFEDTK
jgi:aminotransferase EvaB